MRDAFEGVGSEGVGSELVDSEIEEVGGRCKTERRIEEVTNGRVGWGLWREREMSRARWKRSMEADAQGMHPLW